MATQNNKKTNNKKQNEQIKQSRYTREFVGIFCIVFAIILFIGLFLPHEEGSGAIGSVGLALTTFAKTVAGTGAIAFPIFLLLFGFFLIIDRKKGLLQKRVLGVFLLFFSILGFLHLNEQLIGFRDYTIAGAHGTGGGFFGSVLDYILLSAFGKIGAMIILVAMSLIAFILLTNVMLRDFFSKLGVAVKTSYDKTKTVLDEHNEKTAAYQQAEKNEAPVKILPPIISHEDNNKPFIPLVKNEAAAPADAPPPPTGFSREYLPTVSGASAEKAQNEQDLTEQPATANDIIKATRAADKTISKDGPSAQQGQSYILPTTSLLTHNIRIQNSRLNKAIAESVTVLEDTLDSFGIKAHVTQVVDGPAITRYELQPAPGVKVSKITGLTDDIALALAATDVRIEAPIP
ncbi:MAG: DNA translocase FtsK 4TM domain-containing protein, partial [Clostridia bacterium]|nr:DNA translocase FtsK 4TM domain-containing protein [Clostridia bacterium]